MDLFWVGSHDEHNTTIFIFSKNHKESAKKFFEQTGEKHNFNFKLNDILEITDQEYRIKVIPKEAKHED